MPIHCCVIRHRDEILFGRTAISNNATIWRGKLTRFGIDLNEKEGGSRVVGDENGTIHNRAVHGTVRGL